MLFSTLKSFYEDYQMPLAHVLHHVERRGLLVDQARLTELRLSIDADMKTQAQLIKDTSGQDVVVYVKERKTDDTLCLNSPKDVAKLLKLCGLKVPTDRKTHHETTNEVALQRIFSDSGHAVPKAMLRIRELTKVRGTYVNATLFNNILYCSYIPHGTVGGRRSSRVSVFDIGTNHQNLPKYSDLGKAYRKCIVARPGKIFVACDQKGAEDWIVQALIADNGGGEAGLDELRSGTNRHQKLACRIFTKPWEECDKNHKTGAILYYLAKKTRHGGNYDLRGRKMSEELAKEGRFFPDYVCDNFLEKFHEAEPEIRSVFHVYVQEKLKKTRQLETPIGRRRSFLSLRPFSDNSSVFRDGYSYIPQSTVGDNNGLAILFCETVSPGLVVADGHDAIYLEVKDDLRSIREAVALLSEAYNRTLSFPNGTEIHIPQEYEMGYSFGTLKTFEKDEVEKVYLSVQETDKNVTRNIN